MDGESRLEQAVRKIKGMKNPVILMHELDLEILEKEIESKTTIGPCGCTAYKGVHVKINNTLEHGRIVAVDDVPRGCTVFHERGGGLVSHDNTRLYQQPDAYRPAEITVNILSPCIVWYCRMSLFAGG
jgi:hypothetical protein